MSRRWSTIPTALLSLSIVSLTAMLVAREVREDRGRALSAPRRLKDWTAVEGEVLREGHTFGGREGAIRVVVFVDFECPACARLHATLRTIQGEYRQAVTIVYRHLPLESLHPRALDAALASECAAEQGKFDLYASLLFQHSDVLESYTWFDLAALAALPDTSEFRRCVGDHRYLARVNRDVELAHRLGIRSTPTTVIDGVAVTGARSARELRDWIASAMARGARPRERS
jgi:protein-disulfide isomerase